MKKIVFSVVMLLISSLIFAQKPANKIEEGTIKYSVEWQLPEKMKPMAANFPTELMVFFKGDSASMRTESQMYTSTNIVNTKKEYERMLLDIPMMGKKLSVIFTPADQEKIQEKMPELTLTAGTETKQVAGYKAQKYQVNEKKTNQNFEAWFTKDIEVTPNTLTRYYGQTYGFPVEFNSFMNGITVKAKVKEIKAGAVPAGSFTATKDFEEISFDQLMQMSGGAR
jgi:GLPGLI family protein